MISQPLFCPYCNTRVAQSVPMHAGERVNCPRCGESFAYRPPEEGVNGQGEGTAGLPAHFAAAKPASPPRASNRKTALCVLGIMGLMAALGLTWALATVGFRRANDTKNRRNDVIVPPGQGGAPASPAELVALGYLPPDVNVVAGFQIREALALKEGKPFLDQLRKGPFAFVLNAVEKSSGLSWEQIDHIVVGAHLSKTFPKITLVVHTAEPYLAKDIKLERARTATFRDLPLYRFNIGTNLGGGVLWCPNDRIQVVRVQAGKLEVNDLQDLPVQPAAGADGLARPLRSFLRQRLDKNSLVWLVSHLDRPDVLSAWLSLTNLPADAQRIMAQVQTFGVGSRWDKGVTVSGALQARDEKTVREIEELFRQPPLEGLENVKVEVAPPAAELPDAERNWVTFQARSSLEQLPQVLGKVGALWPVGREK
jgi:hypothetical protein